MDELTFSRLSLFCAEKNSGLLNSTVVHVAVELMDSDSDKEYDDLVAAVAMKSARLYLHRMPRYCENVVDGYFGFEFKRMFRLSRKIFGDLVARYQTSSFSQILLVVAHRLVHTIPAW